MEAYNKITYFGNKNRIKELTAFRNNIEIYFNNIKCPKYWSFEHILNEISTEKRKEINLKLYKIKEIILASWIPSTIYYQSPLATWWVKWNICILENLSQSFYYNFNKEMYFDLIDRTLWVYNENKKDSILRVISPIFWLNKIITYIWLIPYKIITNSWFSINKDWLLIKVSNLFVTLVAILAWIATILNYIWIDYNNIIEEKNYESNNLLP